MSIERDYNLSVEGYTLLSHLGGGGYGTVFLATEYDSSQLHAIKVLHQLGPDPEKRFDREIRILQERSNENCVLIFYNGNASNGLRCYSMEYCPLGSIRKLVHLVSETFVARMLRDVGNGLLPCHERDGFHRDIKPDNILMSEDSTRFLFKISDFGLAHDNNTSSVFTQGAAGTLGYIAPEVVTGGPFTSKADIYSLGITARELLTGNLRRAPLSETQFALATLVNRMTHQDPTRRPDITRVIEAAGRVETALLNVDSRATVAG